MTRDTAQYDELEMMMMRQGWPMRFAQRRPEPPKKGDIWSAPKIAAVAVIAAAVMLPALGDLSWAGDTYEVNKEGKIMANSTYIDRVQTAWGHLGKGKFDELAAMYSADMVLVLPGQEDRIDGRAAFRSALDGIGAALPPGFDINAMHYFEGAEGVVQTIEWTATKLPDGSQSAILWRFNDAGEITEERWFVDTVQWKSAF